MRMLQKRQGCALLATPSVAMAPSTHLIAGMKSALGNCLRLTCFISMVMSGVYHSPRSAFFCTCSIHFSLQRLSEILLSLFSAFNLKLMKNERQCCTVGGWHRSAAGGVGHGHWKAFG